MTSEQKDRFIAEKFGLCTHPRESFGLNKKLELICGICKEVVYGGKFDVCPDFSSESGRVQLFKLFQKSNLYEEMINPDVPPGWFPIVWITNDDGLFRDEIFKALGGTE